MFDLDEHIDCCSRVPASPFTANDWTDEQKIDTIAEHFGYILRALGLNLEDDSLQRTPHRYGKMLVKELFWGLNKERFPSMTTQENKFGYREMLIEANISIQSFCEHHFVPILGYCHIAYFPKDKLVGLSKLNRVAHYFARRPQVQERMTNQIKECLVEVLETEDVAVVVDALHLCVRMRGVQDTDALTRSLALGGRFADVQVRNEFLSAIPALKEIKL